MKVLENQLLVIFGATGDLTRRKLMPALFEIYCQKLLPDHFVILGTGRSELSGEEFAASIKKGLSEAADNRISDETIQGFLRLLYFMTVDTDNPSEYGKIKDRVQELQDKFVHTENCIYYLATPPDSHERIAAGIKLQHLNENGEGWKRIIIEKPFGRDLISARRLNEQLLNTFSEDQIYRIDHYLGKETVQNVMVTRFSNGIFEPLWNRNYISHVEITSAEKIGVENRGRYYEKSGALRDMVQNHLLQLVSIVGMEPPTRMHADAIRNETLKVLQSVRILNQNEVMNHVVRGQYMASENEGTRHGVSYRDEPGISPDSRTETFVALKLFIDNWRWGGVPFYIRTGKCLPTRVTEIVIHFKPTPHALFCFGNDKYSTNNQLIIRIQPDEGILLKIGMKVPGAGFQVQDVHLDFHYADLGHMNLPDSYQRLLVDCMQGDATLFTRGDAIEQAWRIVDPVLNAWNRKPEIPLYGYTAGTWGPVQADALFDMPNMTWRMPCKNLVNEGTFCEL